MRRLASLLVAVVVAWLGAASPSEASIALPPTAGNAYPYDGGLVHSPATSVASERGPPPTTYDDASSPTVADNSSCGALTCSLSTSALTDIRRDPDVPHAQVDCRAGATQPAAGAIERRVYSASMVAAETGATRVAAGAEEACAGGACRVPGQMCFVAGTGVLLASGATVAIEDVKLGDRVLTTDPATGKESAHAVTQLYRHENAPLFDVVIDGSTVTATPTHPFWVVGRGWVTVDQLHAGDALLQPDDTTVTVDAVTATGRTATVYNFEVEDAHDYYVKAGDHWVLVHNDCSISNPASFSGATRAEAEAELSSNGWYNAGSTSGEGGFRWRLPNNIADQVRLMPGRVTDPNPIKQGPYIRFSIGGTKYGPDPSRRVRRPDPLEGCRSWDVGRSTPRSSGSVLCGWLPSSGMSTRVSSRPSGRLQRSWGLARRRRCASGCVASRSTREAGRE